MKVYYNKTFEGIYPVGTSAVIVAENRYLAKKKLEELLKSENLEQEVSENELIELRLDITNGVILNNGDY